jgi:glycosyltransferase involved in cell wall biosynthesis
MNKTHYDVVDIASAEALWIGVRKKLGAYKKVALINRSNGLEQLNYRRMIDDHHAGLTRKGWSRRIWYPLTRLSQVEWAARLADRLLLLNDVDRRYAIDSGWKADRQIDVVPHGVSARYLDAGADDSASERGQGLLFCGSWDHMKGIAYLVAAFERLHAAGRPLRLTVLGPGVPADRVLTAFPDRLRPFVQVVARAPEAEVVRMYRTHDVLLWTSTYEGFGLVLLEAMSQRLPVVTTPVGCAPGLVRDGENGLMVPPRDPEAIAAAVGRLMDDPDLRRTIGDAGRRSVASMTWRSTAERTLAVYRAAISAERT